MTLHGVHVFRELSQQGGLIAAAGSDFQHLRRGLQLEKVQHQGNDVGLRNRLTRSDGKRMILIRLVVVARVHKLVTRDSGHGIEQALVADAASSHLGLHHVLAFDREAIGLEFGNQRGSRILPVPYCRFGRLTCSGLVCVVAGDSPVRVSKERGRAARDQTHTRHYFLRCRTRTSMLTTPFWSRTPTMDTLRVMLYSAWIICCEAWATLVV